MKTIDRIMAELDDRRMWPDLPPDMDDAVRKALAAIVLAEIEGAFSRWGRKENVSWGMSDAQALESFLEQLT